MGITRTGHRYPKKEWAEWRDQMVITLNAQAIALGLLCFPLVKPCVVHVFCWYVDKRRRDAPGMQDALWHCLERSGIVKDDSLLAEVHWIPLGIDKLNPRAEIIIEIKGE